jgi:GABA(A) receptor-associated protein
MPAFRDIHSLEDRKHEALKITQKYPDRVPIIIEKGKCDLCDISKNKFLVSREMTMSQFVFTIRKRIQLDPSQSLFVMVVSEGGEGRLVSSNVPMCKIHEEHQNEDGFIYMIYTSENTFG